jgi:peptidoglycan/xylan/chitin deacetylase (PgdA/CDA1 family)
MNKLHIVIGTIFLGLAAAGCGQNNQQQRTESSGGAVTTATEKNRATSMPRKNTAAQIYAKPQVPVLCYHRIEAGKKGEYTVSIANFTAQMKMLADSSYHSISPAQLYDYLVYNKNLPQKPMLITFDDSRAEHAAIAAPVMEKYGFRGVFFIMTITYNKKNYMTKKQIAQLAKSGHTIGLHSWDHTMVPKYKEEADWQAQVVEPKKKLEKIVGQPVEYWAYPYGLYNHKSAEEMGKYFKLSFSLSTKRDSLVPLQTVRRIITTDCSPSGLLRSMRRTFGHN